MSFPQDPDVGRRPKQINKFLVLYDRPPHRDWLVWWTVGWASLAGVAIASPTEDGTRTSSLPPGLDGLLAAAFFGVLLGVLPAYVRLLIRRWRYRRAMRSGGSTGIDVPIGLVRGASPVAQAPSAQQPRAVSPPSATTGPSIGRDRSAWVAPGDSSAPSSSGVRPLVQPTTSRPDSGPARRPNSGAVSSPIDVLDLSAVRNSEVLSQARPVMPYPVARAVRAIQGATTLRDVYEGVLRGSEALSVVLGVLTTTWARQYGITTPQLGELRKALLGGGVSQGHWISAFASMERPMAQHPQALAGLTEALKRGKGGSGLVADLGELVQERNRWAHGAAPRNELEAAERLHAVFPVFEHALGKARFLEESPWILANDSRYRRREADFQIHASRAMGDHPDFERTTFLSPRPLAEDVFYVRTPDDYLDMTPLVVMRQCPTCHQAEVAYADRLDDRQGVSLKTFDRGHVLFDRSLVEDVLSVAHGGDEGRASGSA